MMTKKPGYYCRFCKNFIDKSPKECECNEARSFNANLWWKNVPSSYWYPEPKTIDASGKIIDPNIIPKRSFELSDIAHYESQFIRVCEENK